MDIKKTAYTIIGFTALFALATLILFLTKTTKIDFSNSINTDIFGNYGSLVGGISASLLSLASVLLIIHSINAQEKTRILQNIESRFFELLRFNRENSNNALSKGKSGRIVFVEINKEFNELFKTIKQWYKVENTQNNEILWQENLINVTFLIIFFGVDEFQAEFLKSQLKMIITDSKVWDNFKNYVFTPIAGTHKATKEENKGKTKSNRQYLKYDGYQNVLGHYFRHIFQTVKFINNQTCLSYTEKYEYIKILRAQLSTHEQVLFFYNSLSNLGKPWEKDEKIKDENIKLITKYNLVKNITFKLNSIIDVKKFYPNVTFEGQPKTPSRIQLEFKYS